MTTSEVAGARPATSPLEDVLQSRRWVLRRRPFAHVIATDVFTAPVYDELVLEFQAYVETESALRYAEQHDFFGRPLVPPLPARMSLFMSAPFQRIFADIFGVPTTGRTTGGVHRHRPGSRNGFPHNDISPEQLSVAFPVNEIADTGEGDGDPASATGKTVRAVAILYYLNNPPWSPGDGGGTGLYEHWSDDVSRPAAFAPPRNNTLLAFECTPYSYHSFMANRSQRDSIIVFLYRPLESFLDQWGVDGLAQFAEG
jgi:hypothetical protein